MSSKAQKIAWEISSYLEIAVGEMAWEFRGPYGAVDLLTTREMRDAARNGRYDALADMLYNDEDLMRELVGDRLYDLTGKDAELRDAVIAQLPSHINWEPLRKLLCNL